MMAPIRRISRLIGQVAYAMVYGPHTAAIFIVLAVFFRISICPPQSGPACPRVLLVQLRGHRDPAAILPLLYVERGAQMTCAPVVPTAGQRRVLLDRHPAAVDAGALAPVAGDVRPRGRPRRAHRRRAGVRAAQPRLAAHRHGRRAHPVRVVGVRPRRAVRQADRQVEAGRLALGVARGSALRPASRGRRAPKLADEGVGPGGRAA